jgi:ABC-type antimicrobial peptide transport system permease subunit
MAIGMGPRRLVAGIVIESLLLTLLGVAIGLAVGVGSIWLLSDGIDLSRWAEGLTAYGVGTKIVPVIRTADLIIPIGVAIVIAAFASLWPALRAVRIRPADAVRHI